MSVFSTNSKIIITCMRRLSPYLELEIKELGYKVESTFLSGVVIRGTLKDCIRLNLHLRCASQVLYSLKEFPAENTDEIYKQAFDHPWEELIPPEGYFSVTSSVSHPSINNNMFVNVRIKDAIADRFRNATGNRPSSGSELKGAVINLFWKNEQAELFIDTSGDSLGRHGYRKIPGAAPMLEALAAATILSTKWDKVSPFVNPMCGSGTLAIEAAMIATDRRPGLYRSNYAFMHLLGYEEHDYIQRLTELDSRIKEIKGLCIIASDNSEAAIKNARINAEKAGVDELIEFEVCDFADTTVPPEQAGVVFMNPEYGDRMGEEEELEKTYELIGDFMKKKCGGYTGYIFTGNLDLAKKIGLKAKRRVEFYNSTIDCRLLEYELYSGSRRVHGS